MPCEHQLDAELHRLHDMPDPQRHSEVHEQAATMLRDPGAQRFHLTHAWIHALVHGDTGRIARLETSLRERDAL